MAKLSGEAITTVNQLSIDDNARADTCAKRDFYEVLHAASGTVSHLAHSGRVSVIGKGYGDAKPVGEHLCQRHDAIVTPLQVGGKLDGASIVVAIRRADTHRLDFLYAANLVDNPRESTMPNTEFVPPRSRPMTYGFITVSSIIICF